MAEPQASRFWMARQAVQQNFLTLWQAQQLLAGRTSGFRVDRYLLLELIGQGGMGRVYLARDTRLNRRVALKILAPERMNNWSGSMISAKPMGDSFWSWNTSRARPSVL